MENNTNELHSYITHIQNEQDIFAKAETLRHIVRDKGFPIKTVAQHLKLSSSYVCNLLRILKLPDLVRDGYYSQLISPTHLFIIARLHDEVAMVEVYEEVLRHSLSTLALEERVREKLYAISSTGTEISDETKKKITEAFQAIDSSMRVKVIQSRIRTKIIVEKPGSLQETSLMLEKLAEKLS